MPGVCTADEAEVLHRLQAGSFQVMRAVWPGKLASRFPEFSEHDLLGRADSRICGSIGVRAQ